MEDQVCCIIISLLSDGRHSITQKRILDAQLALYLGDLVHFIHLESTLQPHLK